MKISTHKLEIIAVIFLYLCALYLWTLPFHTNPMPIGDVDASSHFTIGDYMVSHDTSIAKVPHHVFARYGGQNTAFPGYLWYAPQYWTNLGIAQILSGHRILGPFIFIALFSSLIVLTSYFFIRNLYGFWPAFLSSFLLIFSTRDYMIYLWGQWPQSLSFAFTPLVLYTFYKHYMEYSEHKQGLVYLYFAALFCAAQFFFHPQGMIASLGTVIIFLVFISVKQKRLPLNIKHTAFAALLFIATITLFAPLNIGEFLIELTGSGEENANAGIILTPLFSWYHIKHDAGLPDSYFVYKNVHGSLDSGKQNSLILYWTLPFLLLGILFLLSRRDEKDILFLSWLVAFYVLSRLTVVGMGGRDIRMFAFEAHIFYPLIAIGLLAIPSFFGRSLQTYAQYGFIALFLILTLSVNASSAYAVLKSQQNSIGRINPAQYDAAEWLQKNIPENAIIYAFGTAGFQYYGAKVKWLNVLSQRYFVVSDEAREQAQYVFIDYSDAILLNDQNTLAAIQAFEQNFQIMDPIYNQNNIRVYALGTS